MLKQSQTEAQFHASCDMLVTVKAIIQSHVPHRKCGNSNSPSHRNGQFLDMILKQLGEIDIVCAWPMYLRKESLLLVGDTWLCYAILHLGGGGISIKICSCRL